MNIVLNVKQKQEWIINTPLRLIKSLEVASMNMARFGGKEVLRAGTKKSPKLADFSEKNRISAGLEKILQWKNRMAKNRTKIGINRRKIADLSEKGRFFQTCRDVLYTRGGGTSGPILSAIKSKYRRFFGVFSGILLALGYFSVFDLTVQISSAFFEKSNGYIFYPTVDFKSEA